MKHLSTATARPHLPDGKGGSSKTGSPYMVGGRWYKPMQVEKAYDKTGIASWYGKDFHGRRTANGEIYDMHALSAAHKTLPLPTMVRVTNLKNGRAVIVRVNDRGPFVKGRLIDLSYAAAKELGYAREGTAHVRVQTLDSPSVETQQPPGAAVAIKAAESSAVKQVQPEPLATATHSGNLFIQTGAFISQENAIRQQTQLRARYPEAHLVKVHISGKVMYRVRIGPFHRVSYIEKNMLILQQEGFKNTMVTIE